MKSYTDIEKSCKLAKFLPLESADMYYGYGKEKPEFLPVSDVDVKCLSIPCWSLAALINVLAKIANKIDDDGSVNLSSFMRQWSVNMFDCPIEATDNYDNPIDACYEMILKLNKLNLL